MITIPNNNTDSETKPGQNDNKTIKRLERKFIIEGDFKYDETTTTRILYQGSYTTGDIRSIDNMLNSVDEELFKAIEQAKSAAEFFHIELNITGFGIRIESETGEFVDQINFQDQQGLNEVLALIEDMLVD